MAVTAIWDIKGRVDQVLGYVMNPQKTMADMADLHAIEDVLKYASSPQKTEQMKYVTGINCNPDRAVVDFKQTKKRWKKTGGIAISKESIGIRYLYRRYRILSEKI